MVAQADEDNSGLIEFDEFLILISDQLKNMTAT
jgi:Ca2+-binding EF-hand superfamily protein